MKTKVLQWHPGFFAALQIELADEADKLTFENEHQLSKKPMAIEVVVINVKPEETIQKNIGKRFRRHNIVEYKDPDDYISINDFFKVTGYTCFYQSDTRLVGEIQPRDLTITFVCSHFPKAVVKYLRKHFNIEVEQASQGIYYLNGWIFPVQFIINQELPPDENVWLSRLRTDLDIKKDLEPLAKAYLPRKNQPLYSAVMDLIIRANPQQSEEGKKMCDALRELFSEELEESEKKGKREGTQEGIQLAKSVIKLSAEGVSQDEISRRLELSLDLVKTILEP